ncbi:MAG: hypothetical protein IPP14_04395 [Planctomycetes bacterium]|nr:hypothetical protein [Planctomycetota bacterium]
MKSLRWLAWLLPLVLLAACHDDDEPTPSSRAEVRPELGPWLILTSGGSAVSLAGRSGGSGGDIQLTVTTGRFQRDTGAAFPSPLSNALTAAELDGGVVTYAELVALQAPTVVGSQASFNFVGADFFLPAGVALDLFDAPAGTIDTVQIQSDGMIRLDGPSRTRRAGADSVSIIYSTATAGGGIVAVGADIDTSGAPGFRGGDVSLTANDNLWLRARVRTSGGAATSSLDGADGGLTGVNSLGDMFLAPGSLQAQGGAGTVNGGNGGNVTCLALASSGGNFDWGVDARGGNTETGTGGTSGDASLLLAGNIYWQQAVYLHGGTSNSGSGGDSGNASLSAAICRGILWVFADAGRSATGVAGSNNSCVITATTFNRMTAQLWSAGAAGSVAGDGGELRIQAGGTVRDSLFEARVAGGAGTTSSGNGGQLVLQAQGGSVLATNTVLRAYANGGNGPLAGNGGAIVVDGQGSNANINATDLVLHGDLNGGSGASGGNGGTMQVLAPGGSLGLLLEGALNAGASTGAGAALGGQVEVSIDSGEIDAELDLSAAGGAAVGGTGGTGGSLILDADAAVASGGSCSANGEFQAPGGSSDTQGGLGGYAFLGAGFQGALVPAGLRLLLRGGDSPAGNGGDGGTVQLFSIFDTFLSGGSIDVSGGAGSTAFGTGNGGNGGQVEFRNDDGSIQLAGAILGDGGTGRGSGGQGGQVSLITDNDNSGPAGDIFISGLIFLRGGNGVGSGNGGDGGAISANATAGATALDGDIDISANLSATGGSGMAGGNGGTIELDTEGNRARVAAMLLASAGFSLTGGGTGGFIGIGANDSPASVVLAAGTRLAADGTGSGVAGFITLDPLGAAPNPNLVIDTGVVLSTRDGDGTDQAATNQTLD